MLKKLFFAGILKVNDENRRIIPVGTSCSVLLFLIISFEGFHQGKVTNDNIQVDLDIVSYIVSNLLHYKCTCAVNVEGPYEINP